jgi:hypothetical protein
VCSAYEAAATWWHRECLHRRSIEPPDA